MALLEGEFCSEVHADFHTIKSANHHTFLPLFPLFSSHPPLPEPLEAIQPTQKCFSTNNSIVSPSLLPDRKLTAKDYSMTWCSLFPIPACPEQKRRAIQSWLPALNPILYPHGSVFTAGLPRPSKHQRRKRRTQQSWLKGA